MTLTKLQIPINKLTLGTTAYENTLLTAKVIRNENGFDIATITFPDTTIFPGTVTAGTAVKLEVKESGGSYPTNPMFKGIVRYPIIDIGTSKQLTLSCLGAGYGFGQMLVGAEYGSQSTHPDLDNITDIISDISTAGLLTYYVNQVLASGSSGFSYASAIANITDEIKYISFPYKPANQCLNDLCDLVTALKAGSAGPHWIVTTDNTLRLKLVNASGSGWTKYYGDSQANATLTSGEDYEVLNFEQAAPEANHILYYGVWRRPSNGDSWTEGNIAYGVPDPRTWWFIVGLGRAALTDDGAIYKVGTKSIKFYTTADDNGGTWYAAPFYLPSFTWDLETLFGPTNTPSINFYARRGAGMTQAKIWLLTSNPNTPDWSDRFEYNFYNDLISADTWYHIKLPCGNYVPEGSEATTTKWTEVGSPDWAVIRGIIFYALCPAATHGQLWIDGLNIGNAQICRVAHNSDISPYNMKLITDDVGKDDSLIEGDDSGIMAQLAYAELLRRQTTTYLGSVQLSTMLPEALPGQWFKLVDDLRSNKIVQEIQGKKYFTTLYLSDDLVNGRSRMRFEDLNKIYADMRPEFQDRQATSIKAGQVDINVPRLTVDYAP